MRNETNIHYCKLTIFKLVDQFGFRCMKDDKPAISDLCESALEWAFNALGFEGVTKNSLDSVSDRDYCIETASNLSILQMHLNQISACSLGFYHFD